MQDNILYFDIESTGIELHKARIVSISFILNNKTKTFLVNPGIPIPPASSRIHGIYDNDVKDCPTLDVVAPQILKILEHADYYCGYNMRRYDLNLLKMEMLRCNIEIPDKPIIDVYEVASGLFKSLKLKDLFLVLIGRKFNCHNSADDIAATKELYEYIHERFLKNKNQIDNR